MLQCLTLNKAMLNIVCMTPKAENPAIKRACEVVGSASRLASKIGVSPQMVSQWLRAERPVKLERCLLIERATEGAVTRRDLRPSDWQDIWPELAQPKEPA